MQVYKKQFLLANNNFLHFSFEFDVTSLLSAKDLASLTQCHLAPALYLVTG